MRLILINTLAQSKRYYTAFIICQRWRTSRTVGADTPRSGCVLLPLARHQSAVGPSPGVAQRRSLAAAGARYRVD